MTATPRSRDTFLRIEKENGIATLWLDHQEEKMNVVSPDMMEALESVFVELETDDSIQGAVIISAKKDFIAGADIKSFAIEKKGDFEPIQRRGHAGLARLENSKKPIVAAIHGTAYGLGVELPLACHARVATNHPSTKLALPEVKLGLLPGGGGTQRLPRLVGIQKALDMMLTGKNIFARPAQKMGLVDVLTDHHKLHTVAVQLCQKMVEGKWQRRKVKKSLINRFLDNTSLGQSIVVSQAKKMSAKQTQGNYPAVPAIIDCAETGLKKGLPAGYEKELEHFESLMLTPESAALRYLFFAMSGNKKNPYNASFSKLNTLGMIGAGFMGAGIAEVSINKGIDVLLKDIAPEGIEKARQGIYKGIRKKLSRKAIRKIDAEATMGRLRGKLDYTDFEHCDIIIEAVLETMDLKKRIIDDIQEHGNPDVVIASNTSSLSLTEMANHAQRPEKVIGMHYFSPVPKMPLLEIVKTDKTSEETIAACYDFGVRQGKTVIVVNDGPGFYVNRILAPYLNECLLMIDEGIKIDVIDKTFKKLGFPVGPISLLDEVGLDIAAHVAESAEEALMKEREGFVASDSTKRMYEAGRLGKKNGQGFYTYKEVKGRKKKTGVDPKAYDFFKGNGDKQLERSIIEDRALLLMINEAVMCLEEGIIGSADDGNIGAVFGIGFLPFFAGPFRYIDHFGAQHIVERMRSLEAQYGPKFTPRPMLVEYAERGKKFMAS